MDISTDIYFLQPLPQYTKEKPYTMRYVPNKSVPASNVFREKRTVQVKDVRGRENQFSLDKNGFMVAQLDSKMKYSDFDSQETITSMYFSELRELLGKLFPDSEVDFVSYLVRTCDQVHTPTYLLTDTEKRAKLPIFNRRAVQLWSA